jgi:putative ABC transport system permease protein
MFSFPLIEGDAGSVLDNPNYTVLTPEMAEKYFGDENPVGKTITMQLGETSLDFTVSGVIEEAPSNSSIQYSFLISNHHLNLIFPQRLLETWGIILFPTYVQLTPNTDIFAFEESVSSHIDRLTKEEGFEEDLLYRVQSLAQIHLNPNLEGAMVPSSNPLYSYILAAIAFAVLLIACINFMTLAVGRSSSRAREVGLRKVLGAQQGQIMKQFWGEALFLSVAGLIIGIALAEAFLPTFNELAQKELSLNLFTDWTVLPAMMAITLITAFLAGIYPAMLLSKLYPVDTFRGAIKLGGKSGLIKGLVVLQFAISVFLIVCTFIISSQMKYISIEDLGYNKEMVVTFPTGVTGEDAANILTRFRNQVSGQASVVNVTGFSYAFGQSWLYINYGSDEGFKVLIGDDITGPGWADASEHASDYFYMNWVDPYYIPTMGINIVEGRNFLPDHPADVNGAIILNQTAVKNLGWEDAIGKKLPKGFSDAVVVGVVEDFHYYPMHREIQPLVLHLPRHDHLSSINGIALRIQSEDIQGTLAYLEDAWTNASNGNPFTYSFLDEDIANQYFNELRWRNIVKYSSVFAFLVACLGLFGLTSLAVAKRTREVGIRKVLGASVSRIVTLFTLDFAILVLIANLIAWPIAYIVMKRWLEEFAFRTHISIMTFILTGIIALAIAVLTISFQAVKAALSNPVDALRYE